MDVFNLTKEAYIAMNQENWEKAQHFEKLALKEAQQVGPSSNEMSEALYCRGFRFYKNIDYNQAINLFSRSLKIKEDNSLLDYRRIDLVYYIAVSYLKLKNHQEALKYFNHAFELTEYFQNIEAAYYFIISAGQAESLYALDEFAQAQERADFALIYGEQLEGFELEKENLNNIIKAHNNTKISQDYLLFYQIINKIEAQNYDNLELILKQIKKQEYIIYFAILNNYKKGKYQEALNYLNKVAVFDNDLLKFKLDYLKAEILFSLNKNHDSLTILNNLNIELFENNLEKDFQISNIKYYQLNNLIKMQKVDNFEADLQLLIDKIQNNIEALKQEKAKLLNEDDIYFENFKEKIEAKYYIDNINKLLIKVYNLASHYYTLINDNKKALYYKSLTQNKNENTNPKALEIALLKLDNLIGLASVKEQVRSLTNFLQVQNLRKTQGYKSVEFSHHLSFVGSPGTGKTTVARLIAEIYYGLGIIKENKVIETQRSDLIGEYVGHTAPKVNEVCNKALGGILFIDEAYSLTQGSDNDFGAEAVATLLKRMEDDRDKFVVVVAGYKKEMADFLVSNPGLKSRFTYHIDFPDYNPEELFRIFQHMAISSDYQITQPAINRLKEVIIEIYNNRDKNFANAREVRNLFQSTLANQANRLMNDSLSNNESFNLILPEDIFYSENATSN